ncbi:hypothetical protein [Alistipes ihumii]|uniref:hypothetical protein n=1 Tax=Alistipes ihumii TaxID=1470347 RepID=UPI00307B8E67
MKRKTYRIVWEDDPPRHDAQPSENRAPDTAGRNHAGLAFEQQQSNGMPPTPTSGDSDMPAADETTRSSADKTGSGFVRSETTEQGPSKAIASPTASHPAEPADADRYRTYAPERLMQAGFGSLSPAIPPGYAERHAPQESIYPARPLAGRSSLGSVGNDRQAKADGRYETRQSLDRQQIGEMIDSRLNSLRVYVLESDITDAQRSVKTVVEQASF